MHDLGIYMYIDADLITRNMSNERCHSALQPFENSDRSVVRCPLATFQSLVVTLVLTRLDYRNVVLVGLPTYYSDYSRYWTLPSADHITDALATLHWLRLSEKIEYKIALLTFRVLYRHGSAPPYVGLGPLVPVRRHGRRPLRSTGSEAPIVFWYHQSSNWPSVAVLLQSLGRSPGKPC